MAIPGYMWIKDDQGNDVKGKVAIKGREGSAEVLGFSHHVYIPSDRDTGALTGTRKHEPLIVTKNFCSTSPIINKACTAGKTLQEVKISWYDINKNGEETEYFRHTLSNVKVVAVKPIVQEIKDRNKEQYGHREEIHFRYETIRWEYLDGNIATQDEWIERS